MTTLSAQFVKTVIGTGTGTEISGYLTSVNPVLRHDMSDQTTFTSSGNPVTENQIQGAIQSEFTFETTMDQTVIQALEPQIGSRTGTLWRFYSGTNALPATGDGLFSGYYSIFGVTWNYNAGADVRLVWMLKIADGATTAAPSIGTV